MQKLCGCSVLRVWRQKNAGDRRRYFSGGGRAEYALGKRKRTGARAGIFHRAGEVSGGTGVLPLPSTNLPVSKTAGSSPRIPGKSGGIGREAGRKRLFFLLSGVQSIPRTGAKGQETPGWSRRRKGSCPSSGRCGWCRRSSISGAKPPCVPPSAGWHRRPIRSNSVHIWHDGAWDAALPGIPDSGIHSPICHKNLKFKISS